MRQGEAGELLFPGRGNMETVWKWQAYLGLIAANIPTLCRTFGPKQLKFDDGERR